MSGANRRVRKPDLTPSARPAPRPGPMPAPRPGLMPAPRLASQGLLQRRSVGAGADDGDGETRVFMDSRLGHDFSRVRVHADHRAATGGGAPGPTVTGHAAPGQVQRQHASPHASPHAAPPASPPAAPHASPHPAPATPCPSGVRLGTVRPLNHGDLSAAERGMRRTFLGVVATMELEPGPDHRGHCMQERLVHVSSDCPSALTAATPCSSRDCLPVGVGGTEPSTGISFSAGPAQFVDRHLTNRPVSLLEGTGVDACSVVCSQTYRCDTETGPPATGQFVIRRNFRAGRFAVPGGGPLHVTTGTVTKEQVSSAGPQDAGAAGPSSAAPAEGGER